MIDYNYAQDDMLSDCCEQAVSDDDICLECGELCDPFEDDPKDYSEDAYRLYKNEEIKLLPNYEP